MWNIIDTARLPVVEVTGENYHATAGQVTKMESSGDQFKRVYEAMREAPEQSFADFIASSNFDEATRNGGGAGVHDLLQLQRGGGTR